MKSRTLTCMAAITLFAALALPFQLAAQGQKQRQPRYSVIDLGTLGGGFSNAVGINNKGSVVGWGELAGDTDPHQVDAFLWRKGLMTDLGSFGGRVSIANTVNEADEVAGLAETPVTDPSGEDSCDTGDFLICLPFLWQHGVMTPLPTLGGNNGVATGINSRGQVVGYAETPTPDPSCSASQVGFPFRLKPVLWENGEAQELPTLPGFPIGAAFAINDKGEVVGVSFDCDAVFAHALLWHNGTMIDLGDLGGMSPQPIGINNRGQVVGGAVLPDGTNHAFFWQNGVITDLGTLPGDVFSVAGAINDKGQVIGQSCDINDNCSVFLWQNGIMTDLNALIPADSPLFLFEGNGINSRGEIEGVAVEKSTDDFRAYLATPSNGEATSESATAAARGGTTQRPKFVLPENVRKMLRKRMGFGRFLGTPQKVTLSGAAAAISGRNVTLSPTSLTFSIQAIGTTSAAKTVTLKNSGTTSLTISSIAIIGTNAGNFAQTHTCGSSLAAGASCRISVTFKPTASGTRTAAVSISDNAAGTPQKVTLSGIGTTAKLSPVSLTFSTQAIGTISGARKVTLTNVGTISLNITGITITGTNAGDFAQTHTCGSSLSPGASCSMSVIFKPTASGTRSAALNISDSAAGSPQKVMLSGIGTTAKLSPTSLSFGVVAIATIGTTSPTKTVTLTNVGTTALSITGIAITGTNAGDFFQSHDCGSLLAAGASCAISVTFRPTAIGRRTAAVSITDNAAGSPQKVALSGTGGATGGGSGFCLLSSGNALTGYCIGVFNGICRAAYDPFHCPPGQQAETPGAYLGCPHSTHKVDASRSCAP